MRNRIKTLTFSLILLLSLVGSTKTAVSVPSGQQSTLSSLETSGEVLQFTINIPWEELHLQADTVDGEDYTVISLPEWANTAQSGAPSLPLWTTTLGAPHGAEIGLEVTPGKMHTIQLQDPVVPSPTVTLPWDDPEGLIAADGFPQPEVGLKSDPNLYIREGEFPGTLGRITSDGILRQQRVVGIGLYPVQYDPVRNSITIYETLNVAIRFEGTLTAQSAQVISDASPYEALLREKLINYEQARPWRQESDTSLLKSLNGDESTLRTPWLPPNPGWRIAVIEEGFYELTYDELQAAQVPVDSLVPDTLQLFHQGEEVAIDFLGDDDDDFESMESLLFYGQAIENKYTEENIYWLTYGQAAGKRMMERDVTPGSGSAALFYEHQVTMEENHYYLSAVPGDDDFERFLWTYLYATSGPASWTHNFDLSAPYDGSGTVKISMVGYNSSASINPDHHVKVYLDNADISETEIGEAWWDDVTWQHLEITVPAGLLAEGTNSLRLECPNDTGVGKDLVYIDKIEMVYPRNFTALNNALSFTYDTPGTWQFNISGFSSTPQALFDITDSVNLKRLTGFTTSTNGSETLHFEDDVSEATSYWVLGENTIRTGETITKDTPSNLQDPGNAADYILITPEVFQTQAQGLIDHHLTQDPTLRAQLVLLQDVFDEFNYGITDANAVRGFLQFAYDNWVSPKPTYVVLVGDGHYDPKDFMGYGRTSYFPPYLRVVDPWIGETAADNRFVTLAGEDTMPDMQIGRLSVNSPAEAEAFISKIIAYDSSPEPGDWQKSILAVADNADSAGDFAYMSDSILNDTIPDGHQIEKVYMDVTHYTEEAARTAIQNQFNLGKLFINYIGHASYLGWAEEYLLKPEDISPLTNGAKTPVILAMTCYDGFFHFPHTNREVLGEVSTRTGGRGAVASWSPTGLGVASGHNFLNRGFYDAIYEEGFNTLGEAVIAGKYDLWVSAGSADLLDTYTLFGDPLTGIPVSFVATDDAYEVTEDQVLSVTAENGILINDLHPENATLTALLVTNVTHGNLALNIDGSFTYTPDKDYFGIDSFTYKAFDGDMESNIATVSIKVNSINDPPVAYDQQVQTDVNEPVEIELVATDVDGSGSPDSLPIDPIEIEGEAVPRAGLEYQIVDGPNHGTLSGTPPLVTYTPDADYSGADQFIFQADDGIDTSNIATVRIMVGDNFVIYLPLIQR